MCVYGSLATPKSSNPVSTSTCASGYLYQDLNCYCTSDSQCSSSFGYSSCSTGFGYSPGNICFCIYDEDCLFRDYCANRFCASCTYPFMSTKYRISNCEGIWLNVPWYINLSFGLLFGVGYFLAIYFTESSIAMRLAMVFLFSIPSLDVISDVLYVSTTIFYNTTLFGFCVFFLVLPTCLFIRHLKMRGMRPKWYILKPPPFAKSDLNTIFQIDHSSFYTVFYCSLRIPVLILWAGIKLSPWLLLHSPIFVPVYLLGSLLYVTKLLSLRKVNNLWCRIWSGCDDFAIEEAVDWRMFNESFYLTVLLESVPQLVIQIKNSVDTFNCDAVAILSILASFIMIANALYKMISTLIGNLNIPVIVPFIGNLNQRALDNIHGSEKEGEGEGGDIELTADGDNYRTTINKLFTSSMQEELELLIHREVDRRLTATLANVDKKLSAPHADDAEEEEEEVPQGQAGIHYEKVEGADEGMSRLEKGN